MKRRQFLSALTTTAVSLMVTGCGSLESAPAGFIPNTPTTPPVLPRFLLSGNEAAALVGSGALLLGCSSVVQTGASPLLGGALRVDVDALTVLTESPEGLTNLSALQTFFQALGVQEARPVVVYDDGEMKFAGRVRFLLGFCGASPTWLVNGGAAALQPLLNAGGGTAVPSSFQARATNTPIALLFQNDVVKGLKEQAKVIDVRTSAEFAGQKTLPGDARPGHIPGAISLPVERFFGNGLILPTEQLQALFLGAGLSPEDSLIVYCHDGAKSSLAATLLVQAGYSRVGLYYLSYRDWSQNLGLPVEL